MHDHRITADDRAHLRELEKQQREYARLSIMAVRKALWHRHNDLRSDIPLIHLEAWPFEQNFCHHFGVRQRREDSSSGSYIGTFFGL